ncbi:hypothetical protein [Tahibacter caeni]|uniref:hypothetical protein n=1 Tax=Tahibacter caeni TaxID=1453545 RepID=UPI0021495DC8|nr:hypothetical protein [Tahibacter caeni]
MTRLRPNAIAAAVLLSIIAPANAQSVPDVVLTPLDDTIRHLLPGDRGIFRFRAHGTGAAAHLWCHSAGTDQYIVTTAGDSPASCPDLQELPWSQSIYFPAGDYTCSYAVQRNASSRSDLAIEFSNEPYSGTRINSLNFKLGTVPGLELRLEAAPASILQNGRAQGLVSLVVHNDSAVTVRDLRAGFCLMEALPFAVDGAIAGGCGSSVYGPMCFDFGYGVLLPDVPPRGESSCLVRLTSNSVYERPLAFPIQLIDQWMTDAANGGRLLPAVPAPISYLQLSIDRLFASDFDDSAPMR